MTLSCPLTMGDLRVKLRGEAGQVELRAGVNHFVKATGTLGLRGRQWNECTTWERQGSCTWTCPAPAPSLLLSQLRRSSWLSRYRHSAGCVWRYKTPPRCACEVRLMQHVHPAGPAGAPKPGPFVVRCGKLHLGGPLLPRSKTSKTAPDWHLQAKVGRVQCSGEDI